MFWSMVKPGILSICGDRQTVISRDLLHDIKLQGFIWRESQSFVFVKPDLGHLAFMMDIAIFRYERIEKQMM